MMGKLEITVSENPIQAQMADFDRIGKVAKSAERAFAPVRDEERYGLKVKVTIGYALTGGMFLPIAAVVVTRDSEPKRVRFDLYEYPEPSGKTTRIALTNRIIDGEPRCNAADWDIAFAALCPTPG